MGCLSVVTRVRRFTPQAAVGFVPWVCLFRNRVSAIHQKAIKNSDRSASSRPPPFFIFPFNCLAWLAL